MWHVHEMCDTCLLVPAAAGSEAFGGANGSSVREMGEAAGRQRCKPGKGSRRTSIYGLWGIVAAQAVAYPGWLLWRANIA